MGCPRCLNPSACEASSACLNERLKDHLDRGLETLVHYCAMEFPFSRRFVCQLAIQLLQIELSEIGPANED